jgi:hypothetical protein
MGAQRRSLLFRQFSEIGFSHGALFYRLLILAQHCGRLSTIFNRGSRRAWWPPSLSSSVLSSGFRVQLCALRPALRSALCTLVLCALRLAPRSALCSNTTLTSTQPRLRLGCSFAISIRRLLGSSTFVPAHSGCHWPSIRFTSGRTRSSARRSDLASSLPMYLKQTQQYWRLSLLAT